MPLWLRVLKQSQVVPFSFSACLFLYLLLFENRRFVCQNISPLSGKILSLHIVHGIEIEDVASMAHILVVDDDPSINDLNALTLKREGHDVRQAHDGRAAVKMALESAPDLILLDVMMPVMSGYDIARALYGSSVTRQIPILFFSASAKPDNLEDKRLMPPILGYLSKPCDIHVLVDRVRNALNSL
jgi:CheY-like chemotaxis protein